MNCKQYWKKTLGESSIHGFPYLVRRELHWIEKVFWFIVIILATYFSIVICLNQWKRFRENPIVYAVELAWRKSAYPFVGITLCSESSSQEEINHIIAERWTITEENNITKYNYYSEFFKVLNSLNYMNLDNLKPYENDLSFNDLKLGEALLRIRSKFIPAKDYNGRNSKHNSSFGLDGEETYAAAMTEMGICRTTSQQTRYTNPFGELKSLKVSDTRFCNVMNECNTKIFPRLDDGSALLVFLHHVEDIVAPFDKGTIMRHVNTASSMTIELLLGLTMAEAEVRNLPIAYRKCRYKDENNLKYFEIYRPSFCRTECRINVAVKKCGCKPYFYVVAPHLTVCNVKGMVCLAKVKWLEVANCNCPSLCEEETYVSMQTTKQSGDSSKFESTVIVKLFQQRMAVKRRVVFSTDQLFMSFGGAIGLFLGASALSLYGLLYALSEYVFGKMWSCWKNKRALKRRQHLRPERGVTFVREVY